MELVRQEPALTDPAADVWRIRERWSISVETLGPWKVLCIMPFFFLLFWHAIKEKWQRELENNAMRLKKTDVWNVSTLKN